jgi:hypothetical protein
MSKPTFSISPGSLSGTRCGAAFAALAFLAACATPVPSAPVRLEAAAPPASTAEITMQRDTSFRLSTGYSRTILAMSRWRHVGRLPQGNVYRPVDLAFALEGRQVHEAYLVIDGRALRGFYLPAESAYSPLDPPIQLPFGETK